MSQLLEMLNVKPSIKDRRLEVMFSEDLRDRRLFERVPCSLQGDYISSDGNGIMKFSDISASGVQLNTLEPLLINDQLQLNVTNKRNEPMALEGKVRWCERIKGGWQSGVIFNKPLFVPLQIIV